MCTYPCRHGAHFTSSLHSILSKPLAVFSHNYGIVATMDSDQRGMNPVTMTILHYSKERILTKLRIQLVNSCSQVLYATV